MHRKILILDFGSQYTQLIARRVRELNVFCEIHPFHHPGLDDPSIAGIILSGGPSSVYTEDAPQIDIPGLLNGSHVPVLGICYGAQLISHLLGGKVENSPTREYGRAHLRIHQPSRLLQHVREDSVVWMSHGDSIVNLPNGFVLTADTDTVPTAAFEDASRHTYALQFHPEVTHTEDGLQILRNFIEDICGVTPDWTPASFAEETILSIRNTVGNGKVICGLSGGVDSTVAATLVHQAIGHRQTCIFVDNGLLRKGEFEQVMEQYQTLGLNVIGVDASDRFLNALEGMTDPEAKRKAIGRVFIEVFDEEASKIEGADWLVQGTIYPDVIESVSVKGPSVTIKSHHNVGGLPDTMKLKVLEPLRMLFKDEVRRVGRQLGLSESFIGRHPFPGPGLAIRCLGEITRDKLFVLKEVDNLFIQGLRDHNLYDQVWQAFCVLLPVQSVGVMGDERTYENVVALRAVTSIDGMTADWAHLPYPFLAHISNTIINRVKGVNRVVYDISSKPPATIEWE